MCASHGGWAERRVHEGAKESASLDQVWFLKVRTSYKE